MRLTIAVCCIIGCLIASSTRAEILPTLSFRELAIDASDIVLATPLDSLAKVVENRLQSEGRARFQVDEVYSGNTLKKGDVIEPTDLSLYNFGQPFPRLQPGEKPSLPRIKKTLLFVKCRPPDAKDRRQPAIVISGIRYLTEDQQVLWPRQFMNPGPYYMQPEKELTWDKLLEAVRAEIKAVDSVMAKKRIEDPAKRNQAIFAWIQAHRNEFRFWKNGRASGEGWESLEQMVFDWILDTCITEDCWRALTLMAELRAMGSFVSANPEAPWFGSNAGREFLLKIAIDERHSLRDRVLAVEQLGDRFNLWPYPDERWRWATRVEAEEQTRLLDKLTPLVNAKETELRLAAVRTCRRLSHPRDGALRHLETKQALPVFLKAYNAEPPGALRDELALAVRDIGGPKHWQELTGNVRGFVVLLSGFTHRDGHASFSLQTDLYREIIKERPTLVLERVDKNGQVVETKKTPMPVRDMMKTWAEGWDGAPYLPVVVPTAGLREGMWRVQVKGVLAKDGAEWKSEPKTFTEPALPVKPAKEPR